MESNNTTTVIGALLLAGALGALKMVAWGFLVGLGFYLINKMMTKVEYALARRDLDDAYQRATAQMEEEPEPRKEG